jgi:hypothetical protein
MDKFQKLCVFLLYTIIRTLYIVTVHLLEGVTAVRYVPRLDNNEGQLVLEVRKVGS